MTDSQHLMRQIASAGARMDPALSDRDVERLVAGARVRRRRRTVRRVALASGAACVLISAVVVTSQRASQPPSAQLAAQPHGGPPVMHRIVRLADGSSAVALDATTEIAIVEEHADRVDVSLGRGRGRFNVTRRPARTFAVRAGDVTITVLGTIFTVERVADRVGVTVERGTVRVDWGVGSALVNEGQSGWYPPLVVGATRTASAAKTAHALSGRELARGARSLARSRAASPAPAATKVDSAEDLLHAADRARLAGDAEQGVDLLRKLLREHRNDPRAPLAAFTLGRMLLMELARPREAAAAFAEAQRISPRGPFAEDALAREVEALHQAGLSAEAHARAGEYLRRYPDGRRAATVRTMGGIK